MCAGICTTRTVQGGDAQQALETTTPRRTLHPGVFTIQNCSRELALCEALSHLHFKQGPGTGGNAGRNRRMHHANPCGDERAATGELREGPTFPASISGPLRRG